MAALTTTKQKLDRANKRISNYERKLKRAQEVGEKAMQAGMRTASGMGSAFGVAWVQGRYPENSKVFGVDLSLLIGLGGTVTGAMGWAGGETTNEIVGAIGDGALCAFAALKGYDLGAEAA